MNGKKISISTIVWRLIFAGFAIGVVAYGSYVWQENKAMDEMAGAGLVLINYSNKEVFASVHNSKFPNPGDGAVSEAGPKSGGGGLDCCVPIPVRWRPGIKMIVWYSHTDRRPENGVARELILPEFPDGRPGSLYLIFHSDDEFELLSSIYAPGHPRWPGKQIEPVIQGLK